MDERAADFADRAAAALGVDVDVHEFPAGTRTAADAADAVGCDVAQIAKSVVLAVDGDLVVVLTSGANRVDEDALAAERDAAAVDSADPWVVSETLGWSVGGVPPFCHDAPVEVLFDPSLAAHDEVWCAAGTPETVFPIGPDRLRDLADAAPTDAVE